MNKEDIIRMAREAFIKRGFWPNEVMWECWKDAWLESAAAEREACAKVCEDEDVAPTDNAVGVQQCIAAAIRARGDS